MIPASNLLDRGFAAWTGLDAPDVFGVLGNRGGAPHAAEFTGILFSPRCRAPECAQDRRSAKQWAEKGPLRQKPTGARRGESPRSKQKI